MNIRGATTQKLRGQRGVDKVLDRTMPTTTRVCLGCEREFQSYSKHNRMCPKCRGKVNR